MSFQPVKCNIVKCLPELADLASEYTKEVVETTLSNNSVILAMVLDQRIGELKAISDADKQRREWLLDNTLNLPVYKKYDKLPISGTNKVALQKIRDNVYRLDIPRFYDILCGITPSFPISWIKRVKLSALTREYDASISSTDTPCRNLFFSRPIVHNKHIDFSIEIHTHDYIDDIFEERGLCTVDILGVMVPERKIMMEKAEKIILDSL
jgi:hypothetical protein